MTVYKRPDVKLKKHLKELKDIDINSLAPSGLHLGENYYATDHPIKKHLDREEIKSREITVDGEIHHQFDKKVESTAIDYIKKTHAHINQIENPYNIGFKASASFGPKKIASPVAIKSKGGENLKQQAIAAKEANSKEIIYRDAHIGYKESSQRNMKLADEERIYMKVRFDYD